MHDHDTPTPKRLDARRGVVREPRTCQHCGKAFIPKRQTRGLFCSNRCYRLWWGQNGQREASKKGLARLAELRAAGTDPRTAPQATWKRYMAYRNTALSQAPGDADADNALWTERARYWIGQADDADGERSLYRRRERKPLVLVGHGIKLRVHRGTLLVTHGFTHYPQESREERFFRGDPRLPSRILLVSADGYLSLEVVRWLAEQRVPLVVLDYRGEVVSIISRETAAADLELRRAQIAALDNGSGFKLAKRLIERKLEGSLATLATLPASPAQEVAIDQVATLLHELRENPPSSIDELRLLEARAAHVYFTAWRSIPIRWKGTRRQPIPPEWNHVGLRGDFFAGGNRNSHHPLNTMLNYGYGVLASQVRIAIAEIGLDPTIGYLHVNAPGRATLVYDLMEPHRPKVDQHVLGFIRSEVFEPGDFVVDARGVCRLHPELARRLAADGECFADISAKLDAFLGPGGDYTTIGDGQGQGAGV